MTPLPPSGLYAITSAARCSDETALLSAVDAAIRGGIRLLQYRDKLNPPDIRERQASRLLQICRAAAVPLIINDDITLVARIGADGVHLGVQDGSVQDARAILGAGAIVGVTCSDSLSRAIDAEHQGASYVAFGACFPSSTKPGAPVIPLDRLREARQRLRLPICAIGGITAERARQVTAAGADYLAAVQGVFGSADTEQAALAYAVAFRP